MKAGFHKTVEITLTLSEAEARWLKGMCQNPLVVDGFDEELDEEREIRQNLFTVLKEAGI